MEIEVDQEWTLIEKIIENQIKPRRQKTNIVIFNRMYNMALLSYNMYNVGCNIMMYFTFIYRLSYIIKSICVLYAS